MSTPKLTDILPVLLRGSCVLPPDPDTRHSPNMPIDCLKSSNYGEQWRNSIRGYFHDRIKAGNITIFDREVAMQHFRPQA